MSTALALSNQKLLVNIDYDLQVKDLYFPHIGQDNQLNRYQNQMFFMFDGQLRQLNDSRHELIMDYEHLSGSAKATLLIKDLELNFEFTDYVVSERNIYIREFTLNNLGDGKHEVRIFFQNNYALNESLYADTAVWYQPAGCLLHYKKNCYLAVGSSDKLYQMTCAAKDDNFGKGAYPNELGELWYNPVATGNVNSCLSFKYNLEPHTKISSNVFTAAALSLKEVEKLVAEFKAEAKGSYYQATRDYWKELLSNTSRAVKPNPQRYELLKTDLSLLAEKFWRSVVILYSQMDKDGCIVAANDGQFLKLGGSDSYSYYWPRDGANTILALNALGLKEAAETAILYALRLSGEEGFFLHKYFPAASAEKPALGSSWHSWTDHLGRQQLPIQEDATAMMLIAIADYYNSFKDSTFLSENWQEISAMISFLMNYNCREHRPATDISDHLNGIIINAKGEFPQDSALPAPSYDVWEQHWGIFTHTAVLVLESINKAQELAKAMNEMELTEALLDYHRDLQQAIMNELRNKESGIFYKGIRYDVDSHEIVWDEQADIALLNAYNITSDEQIRQGLKLSMEKLLPKLTLKTPALGYARKEQDDYLRVNKEYTGNPWILSSLWMARAALRDKAPELALKELNWVIAHSDTTGLLPEQLDPYTGFSLGVKPLTWSHAEFLLSVKELIS